MTTEQGFRRLQRLGAWADALPEFAWRPLALLGAHAHPFAEASAAYAQGCADGLGASAAAAAKAARDNVIRHVLGYFRSRRYGALTVDWWRSAVCIDDAGNALETLLARGGLVLASHVPEWHLLPVMLGQARRDAGHSGGVFPVAISERESPYHAVVGAYLRRLHEDTGRHLNHGGYIFLEPGASRRDEIAALLATQAIVVVLNDVNHPEAALQPEFLGRPFGVRSGAVRLALDAGSCVYSAWWQADGCRMRYSLRLARLLGATPQAILEGYFKELAVVVARTPDAWDGWRWLPAARPPMNRNG